MNIMFPLIFNHLESGIVEDSFVQIHLQIMERCHFSAEISNSHELQCLFRTCSLHDIRSCCFKDSFIHLNKVSDYIQTEMEAL